MLPPLGWSVWLSRKRFRALATESFWNSKVQLIIQVLLMDFVPQCPSQIRWPALRTCICKRIGALNTGLARFEGASKLTSIQNLTFVFLLVNSFSTTYIFCSFSNVSYIYLIFKSFCQGCKTRSSLKSTTFSRVMMLLRKLTTVASLMAFQKGPYLSGP